LGLLRAGLKRLRVLIFDSSPSATNMTLSSYLTTSIRRLNRWLKHPEREPDTASEGGVEETINELEHLRAEVGFLRRLSTKPLRDMLMAGCSFAFPQHDILIEGCYVAAKAQMAVRVYDTSRWATGVHQPQLRPAHGLALPDYPALHRKPHWS
jgi:hypothetical protein